MHFPFLSRSGRTAWLTAIGLALSAPVLLQAGDDPAPLLQPDPAKLIGRELGLSRRLLNGGEFSLGLRQLLDLGESIFAANWTVQEGAGRPLTKGTGAPLTDASAPLEFPRNFNRVSGPDANSCAGCHNAPLAGGSGDVVANVFVLGQRFDFARFDGNLVPTVSAADETGTPVTLQGMANSRATPGMSGAGFIEMLARQMTAELQAQRNALAPGQAVDLTAKGVAFGRLARRRDGSWLVDGVNGLAAPSLVTAGAAAPPSLLVRPFHQAGQVISLRQFANNAFNHHHGIQSTERFGDGVDADGDGWANEMTRAEVTAVSVFQAVMAVPGRVIPRHPQVEQAILRGEQLFPQLGCAECHRPTLELDNGGWIFTEPNPFNPPGNLRPGEAPTFSVDLGNPALPPPRLRPNAGVVSVPAYTDLKLHDITSGATDPNREPLDMGQPAGSPGFFAGNGKFLTRKLWDIGKKPNYFHHGLFTTIRQAVEAHAGEALASAQAFAALPEADRNAVIEFLKSLQVLKPGTRSLVVDENGEPRPWPPVPGDDSPFHD
jgi:mono/diheme cytochrome c family protein